MRIKELGFLNQLVAYIEIILIRFNGDVKVIFLLMEEIFPTLLVVLRPHPFRKESSCPGEKP